MRGSEHINAHCPGAGGGHEVVVMACAHCLDALVGDSLKMKDQLVSVGTGLEDAIIQQAKATEVIGPISFNVICAGCRSRLKVEATQTSMNGKVITVAIEPHNCNLPPKRKSIIFGKDSNPQGAMNA